MDLLECLTAEAASFRPDATESQLWRQLEWLDRLELALPEPVDEVATSPLVRRLQSLRMQMESSHRALYERLRTDLRRGAGIDRLSSLLGTYAPAAGSDGEERFDALDELMAGILQVPPPGSPSVRLEANMVAYQPTPARHVLDLLHRCVLGPQDVLVDLGAGLGHVPLLAALCSPARTCGIEIEPTYVRSARAVAGELGLDRVSFLCQDVREADLSVGTVFYLYTPFRGELLAQVLERLRHEAATRPVRICAFGPCALALQPLSWLQAKGEVRPNRITVFEAAG